MISFAAIKLAERPLGGQVTIAVIRKDPTDKLAEWLSNATTVCSYLLDLNSTEELDNILTENISKYNRLKFQLFAECINLENPEQQPAISLDMLKSFLSSISADYEKVLEEEVKNIILNLSRNIPIERTEQLKSALDGSALYGSSILKKISTILDDLTENRFDVNHLAYLMASVSTLLIFSKVDYILMTLFMVSNDHLSASGRSLELLIEKLDELVLEIEDTIIASSLPEILDS